MRFICSNCGVEYEGEFDETDSDFCCEECRDDFFGPGYDEDDYGDEEDDDT